MTDTPAWFTAAIDTLPERIHVDAVGASINAFVWGDAGKPGIVLIHGGAAHAQWWSHIAPAFLPDYRVVALDLSGHGDSDRRERYGLDLWTDEVIAVIDAAEFASKPVVVGHSMGGFVTIATAARHNDRLGGAIIIDSPVVKSGPRSRASPGAPTTSQRRRCMTIPRFRLRSSERFRRRRTTSPT